MSAPMAGPPPMPPPAYGMPPPMMPMQQHSALPVAGGALLIVAGLLGIAQWGWVIAAGASVMGFDPTGGALAGIILVCGAIGIIFSLIALLGGVFAIQRKMWGLGIAGGIMGLLSFGFVIGSVLALVGLILVAVSHKEFT